MPQLTPIQPNFNGGELSPFLEGRVDLKAYRKGLRTCTNWIPLPQGALMRRPGTLFIKEVKDSSKAVRLVKFVFSATQAYVLEFGHNYIRFFRNRGLILSGGNPYEVVTTYASTDLANLYFYQSADVLFIASGTKPLATLSRTSDTNWTLADYTFVEPPFLGVNATATTLTASGTTGNITITASANVFAATDVGRAVRISVGTPTWGWATITAFTSATSVAATVNMPIGGTTATTKWALGLYSPSTGYPVCGTFMGNRHVLSGGAAYPSSVAASVVGDFSNFSPSALSDGVIADDNAFVFTLGSDMVENIQWLAVVNKGLAMGTVEQEWVLRASAYGEAITPTNVKADPVSAVGSARVNPVRTADEVMFVQSARKQMWSYGYDYSADAFATADRTLYADHILDAQVADLAFQRNPFSIVWVVDKAGGLKGFTYNRSQEVFAWHKHTTDGLVKTVASIPNPTNTADDLYMVVSRTINGSTKQYVEVLAPYFSHASTRDTAVCLDSALTYSGAATTTVSGLGHLEGKSVVAMADGGQLPPAVVTSGAITLSDGFKTVSATNVVVGLLYESVGLLQRVEIGDVQVQTSQGDLKRVSTMFVRLWKSLGLKVGEKLADVKTVVFRNTDDVVDTAVPLFTGDAEVVFPSGYSYEGDIHIYNKSVYPTMILSLVSEMTVGD